MSNGDLPVALEAVGGGGDGDGGETGVAVVGGGDSGKLAVELVGFCTVLFADIVGEGGETGAAVVGGSDGAAETAGGVAGVVAGIGMFKQGVGISI